MCRHLAYLGTPVALSTLVLEQPHSLVTQAYAPRWQQHGTVNVDGFGAGWYVPGQTRPVRYRRAQPIWSDASFASLAPTIESSCVVAAVRGATPGYPADESCVAPFTHGPWLFSHNGKLADLPRVRSALASVVGARPDHPFDPFDAPPEAFAPVDSAVVFGHAAAWWASGASLADGLAAVVRDVAAAGGGRLNLLATDGTVMAATAYGDSLFTRTDPGSVVVASEPYDDDPAWSRVPPNSVVEATSAGLTVTPLTMEDS